MEQLEEILGRIRVVSEFLNCTDYKTEPEVFVRRLQTLTALSQQALQAYLNPAQPVQ